MPEWSRSWMAWHRLPPGTTGSTTSSGCCLSFAAAERVAESPPAVLDRPVGARECGAELRLALCIELHPLAERERGQRRPAAGGRLHGCLNKLPTDDAVLQIAEQVLQLDDTLGQSPGRLAVDGFEELGCVTDAFA